MQAFLKKQFNKQKIAEFRPETHFCFSFQFTWKLNQIQINQLINRIVRNEFRFVVCDLFWFVWLFDICEIVSGIWFEDSIFSMVRILVVYVGHVQNNDFQKIVNVYTFSDHGINHDTIPSE